MSYKDFYTQIKNPLLSDDVIKRLIRAYSECGPFCDYYLNIVETYNYPIEPFDRTYEDRFFELVFNKWKNLILRIPSDRVSGPDVLELQRILRNAPPIKSKLDFMRFESSNSRISDLMETYSWTHDSHWQYMESKRLRSSREESINISHRLYIDVSSKDLHKVAILLIEKLDEKGLKYNFKISTKPSGYMSRYSRSDPLVMYADTENLLKYVEVLREIKREHPEIVFREPPILAGKIDGWIGYGSEPGLTPSGKGTSFNLLRSNIAEKSIGMETKKYITDGLNNPVPGKNITIKELFLSHCAESFMEEQRKALETELKRGTIVDKSDEGLRRSYGYSLSDLNTYFRNLIVKGLDKYFDYIMGDELKRKAFSFNGANGKQLYFYNSTLSKAIRTFALEMSKTDPNFISTIRRRIAEDAKKEGIDPNNFCFDTRVVQELKKAEIARRGDNNIPPSSSNYGGHGAKS